MDPAVAFEAAALSHRKGIDQATAHGTSDIQQFYCNSTVFITGGSGFIGKQLVEKLFRSCNIKKIYMLLRAKKEVMIKERLMEVLKDPVFDAVREQKPGFIDRITSVEGDIAEMRLGVCELDWNMMAEEVDVIFHVAATTKFDEHIREAALINVRGTREALQLGRACKKLRAFVHVSTAYSHATSMTRGGDVLEQFYESPLSPETLIQMAEQVDAGRLDDITPAFIRGWPNTYTFTKAVAEEQVRLMSSELPLCIVRPSVVISSYREPCPAWLDLSCTYSASGFLVGSGLGINHVLQADKHTDTSIVPVDFVNNALIAAGWAVGARETERPREAVIYNMVTSGENVILFEKLLEYLLQAGRAWPSPLAVWKIFVISTQSYNVYLLLILFLHFIPALIFDGALLITGNEPRFVKLLKKIHKLTVTVSYFMNTLHKMDDRNLTNLKQKLSESDRVIFNFDMTVLNWPEMVNLWCIGVRKYILKDGLINTEKAVRKQLWFGILNYLILAISGYVAWIIVSSFFGGVLGFFLVKSCT